MSLSELFAKALSNASKAYDLPTVQVETQELVQACLKDLNAVQSRITALALFSPNESLEDIGSRDLVYLLVPYVLSEACSRVKATERDDRLQVLDQTQKHLENFLSTLEDYVIISGSDRSLYEQRVSLIRDARQRREVKIKQYQREKELRTKIEAIRKRRGLRPIDSEGTNDFDLILALLPSSSNQPYPLEDDERDSDTEDAVREATLLLLRLMYLQAQGHIESTQEERELLQNAPPPPSGRGSEEGMQREHRHIAIHEENQWKLDSRSSFNRGPDGAGHLFDPNGKPLRPFTILPSEASSRARLQAQVFGPGHQLPTMTIDEYLEIERQRGNILTGGGRASQEAPTSTEGLTISSEMDGTREGDEKAEELRQKQEKWAQYTDASPRGAGNTMNRG